MKTIIAAIIAIALSSCALSPDRPPSPAMFGSMFPAGPAYTGTDVGPGYKAKQ